jgi:hypothetical protein
LTSLSKPTSDRQAAKPPDPSVYLPRNAAPQSTYGEAYVEIRARHELQPLRQGHLDGLCSLYAIINAIRLATAESGGITHQQNKRLFALGMTFLAKQGSLQKMITEGLCRRRRKALARHLAEVAGRSFNKVTIERPDREKIESVGDVFDWITLSLLQNKPVLIPLMGTLNHLTVVSRISERRLTLFDSGGLYYVRKSSCGLKGGVHQIQVKGLMRVAVSARHCDYPLRTKCPYRATACHEGLRTSRG